MISLAIHVVQLFAIFLGFLHKRTHLIDDLPIGLLFCKLETRLLHFLVDVFEQIMRVSVGHAGDNQSFTFMVDDEAVCRLISIGIGLVTHIFELAVTKNIECTPYSGVTASYGAEVKRIIGISEREILVFALKISLFSCKTIVSFIKEMLLDYEIKFAKVHNVNQTF